MQPHPIVKLYNVNCNVFNCFQVIYIITLPNALHLQVQEETLQTVLSQQFPWRLMLQIIPCYLSKPWYLFMARILTATSGGLLADAGATAARPCIDQPNAASPWHPASYPCIPLGQPTTIRATSSLNSSVKFLRSFIIYTSLV